MEHSTGKGGEPSPSTRARTRCALRVETDNGRWFPKDVSMFGVCRNSPDSRVVLAVAPRYNAQAFCANALACPRSDYQVFVWSGNASYHLFGRLAYFVVVANEMGDMQAPSTLSTSSVRLQEPLQSTTDASHKGPCAEELFEKAVAIYEKVALADREQNHGTSSHAVQASRAGQLVEAKRLLDTVFVFDYTAALARPYGKGPSEHGLRLLTNVTCMRPVDRCLVSVAFVPFWSVSEHS